jgi:hypothetical protein
MVNLVLDVEHPQKQLTTQTCESMIAVGGKDKPCPLFSFALVGFDTPAMMDGLDILVVLVSLVIIVRSCASVTTNTTHERAGSNFCDPIMFLLLINDSEV